MLPKSPWKHTAKLSELDVMKSWGFTPLKWQELEYLEKLEMMAHDNARSMMEAYQDHLQAEEIRRKSKAKG
jgi:hypothetical protein